MGTIATDAEIARLSELVMPDVSIHRLCNHLTSASFDRGDLLMILDAVVHRVGKKEGTDLPEYMRLKKAYYEYEQFCAEQEEAARIRNYRVTY